MTLAGCYSRSTLSFYSPANGFPGRLLLPRCLSNSAQVLSTGNDKHKDLKSTRDNGNGRGGQQFSGRVPSGGAGKFRLDSWLSAQMPGVSRARIQSSVRHGFVQVNGNPVLKISHTIRAGDIVSCSIAPLAPLRADPEDVTLDIIYEDNDVIVVNKPARMVVHPAPGNLHGTLVNGILYHSGGLLAGCSSIPNEYNNDDERCPPYFDSSPQIHASTNTNAEALVRPGIVHRLDKGTSGLLVVAKNEQAHACLSDQFESRTIFRRYVSLTCGVPPEKSGRIQVPIARDQYNRIRMAAVSNPASNRRARFAASRYSVVEEIGGGGVGLVEWQLETGRTHQIRVHAQYLGFPLLGDDTYGGTKGLALSRLKPKLLSKHHADVVELLECLERPCLHALSLGFKHPQSGEFMKFSCPPPADYQDVLDKLRSFGAPS